MYYDLIAKIKTKDGEEEIVFQGAELTEAMVIGAMEKLNPMYGGALLNVKIMQHSEEFIFNDNKKPGKWLHENMGMYYCSECNLHTSKSLLSQFCPCCGAEMKEIEEGEEEDE